MTGLSQVIRQMPAIPITYWEGGGKARQMQMFTINEMQGPESKKKINMTSFFGANAETGLI